MTYLVLQSTIQQNARMKAQLFVSSIYYKSNIYLLFNITTNMKILPAQQLVEQKKINRKRILALNRRYKRRVQEIDQKQFKMTISSWISPIYKMTIITLSRIKYGRKDINQLVQYIADQDILRVYQGALGLRSFGVELISNDNDEELLAMDIVSKLVKMVGLAVHPFLQYCSLYILNSIIAKINANLMRVYFNRNIIPCTLFIDALHYKQPIFSTALKLFNNLNGRIKFIDGSDNDLFFLIQIECIVKGLSKNKQLRTVEQLIGNLKTYHTNNHRQFTNRYFKIKRIILSKYKQNGLTKKICKQLAKNNLWAQKYLIQYKNPLIIEELAEMQGYAWDVIGTIFELTSMKNGALIDYFNSAVWRYNESGRTIRLTMLKKVEELFEKNLECSYTPLIEQCLKIFNDFVYLDLRKEILNNKILFSQMASLYKLRNSKIDQQLNIMVAFLISCDEESSFKMIIENSLIQQCFNHCLDHCMSTSRATVYLICQEIMKLKQKNYLRYELVRRQVATEDIYAIINKVKQSTTINFRNYYYYSFYDTMKKEQDALLSNSLVPYDNSTKNTAYSFGNQEVVSINEQTILIKNIIICNRKECP